MSFFDDLFGGGKKKHRKGMKHRFGIITTVSISLSGGWMSLSPVGKKKAGVNIWTNNVSRFYESGRIIP
jgi:hypothetical protein